MSTTGMESWAVDLAEVGAIYPFQGAEAIMVVIGLAFWVFWHVWQIRFENRTYEAERAKLQNAAVLERAMRHGRLE